MTDGLGAIEAWFRRLIREELRSQTHGDEWIPQRGSALGNRRHCAAVRRRVENNEGGAAIKGKRFLLTTAALSEELRRGGPPPEPSHVGPGLAKVEPEDDEAYTRILRIAGLA